jgi:ribokinase
MTNERHPNVCVVGSVNVDLVVRGPRLPRPGETVTGGVFHQTPGGKGANQALAARNHGAAVTMFAAVGADPLAEVGLGFLRAADVDLSRVVTVPDESTGVAVIVVDQHGENQIAVAPGANRRLRPEDLELDGFDAVLCQLEIPDETVVEAARQTTGLFCVNAAPARPLPDEVLERADVIIVNQSEHDFLHDQLARFDGLLVLTLGAEGAVARRNGGDVASAVPPPVEPVDTVGAGDAFCGSLVTDLARGMDIDSALNRACVAGAEATTRPGAQHML